MSMNTAKIVEELGEVARDLWNAGKLNSQARALERIAEEIEAAQRAPNAVLGVLHVAATMGNMCFDYAQKEGYTLTAADCALLSDLRKEWDGVRQTHTRGAAGEMFGMKVVIDESIPLGTVELRGANAVSMTGLAEVSKGK